MNQLTVTEKCFINLGKHHPSHKRFAVYNL